MRQCTSADTDRARGNLAFWGESLSLVFKVVGIAFASSIHGKPTISRTNVD